MAHRIRYHHRGRMRRAFKPANGILLRQVRASIVPWRHAMLLRAGELNLTKSFSEDPRSDQPSFPGNRPRFGEKPFYKSWAGRRRVFTFGRRIVLTFHMVIH